MSSTNRSRTPVFPGLLLALILLLTAACSTAPTGTGAGSTPAPGTSGKMPTPGVPPASPTVQTQPMPQTDTTCPAANTARAAVMRPLMLGQHQNLVYISNEVPPHTSSSSGHVRRYESTTGKSITIVESGLRISQAQVSADGQWVLLLSVPDPRGDPQHNALLQLVRMDGQGLQTLYCFPATARGEASSIQAQWSMDEQSIVVSVETEDASATYTTSQVFVLDVANGAIRQLFLDQDDPAYGYRVMTWLDATRFYVIRSGTQPGVAVPLTLYLMNTSTATVANPGLHMVTSAQGGREVSMDSSYDGTTLFTATCLTPSSGTIAVEPAAGGASQVIFSSGNACAIALRAISTTTLFLLARVAGGTSYQAWTMHPDGSDRQVLTTLTGSEIFEMNATSQFPWSTVSRDGTYYALQQGPAADRQSILLGRLRGGPPTVVLTASNQSSGLDLAGWTTM